MSERLKGRGHIVFAVVFTLLAAAVALWGGQWQAKDYKGKGLGLFVADGDTTTTGYLEADTAAVDTAHFLKASVHRLDGWRAGIDTLHSAIDSTSALYVNTANTDQGYAWLENYTLNTAADFWGLYGAWYKKSGASNQNDYLNGMWFDVSMGQTGGVLGGLYGFAGIAELANGQMGTPDTARYLMGGEARTNAVGGTLYGSMIGFFNEAIAYGTLDSITGDAVGTWVHTATEHVGGSTYGILLDDDTGTDWGIYQTGTSPNYLWGLGLGDSLTVEGNIHAAAYYGDGSNLTGITAGELPAHIEAEYVGTDTLEVHGQHLALTAPYDDGGWGNVGFIKGTADVDSVTIPYGRGWVGVDLQAELDNGVLIPYTHAMGADLGVTVYADTGHVGALTGGEFSASVSGGAGMVVGTDSSKASGWGLIGTFSAYIDSIISGSGGSGGILAQATMSTTKAPKVAALRTETSGGAGVDTLVSIWMQESASNDWGIYQNGTAPNKLAGPIYTQAVHADSFYGDGSNLTGISGGPGGTTDHGELDSLSLLDDDHPQYLLRAGFPDSFATSWPVAFAAAMTDSVRPALHDTAQAVRSEMYAATSFPGIFWRKWWTSPGSELVEVARATPADVPVGIIYDDSTDVWVVAYGALGMKTYQLVDGELTQKASEDSVAVYGLTTTGRNGWIVTSKNDNDLRSWSLSSAGALTRVGKTTINWPDAIYHPIQIGTGQGAVFISLMNQLRTWTITSTGTIAGWATTGSFSSPTGMIAQGPELFAWRSPSTVQAFTINADGTVTGGTSVTADSVRGVCANSGYMLVACKRRGVLSFDRQGSGLLALKDSLQVGNYATAIACNESNVFIGMTNVVDGIIVASIDTAGHMVATDTLSWPGDAPVVVSTSAPAIVWSTDYLATASASPAVIIYEPTDSGMLNYTVKAAFHDSSMFQGPVTITQDSLPTSPDTWHDLLIVDGDAYTYIEAGSDPVSSSSRKLKQTNGVLGQGLGGAVLAAISRMPIYWWKWKQGDTSTQHVGPVAEDFYEVGKLVAPRAATDSTIAGEHETAALFLAVKELSRRNDSLAVELADAQKRMAAIERACGKHDTPERKERPPRIRTAPERPEPQPRRGRQ